MVQVRPPVTLGGQRRFEAQLLQKHHVVQSTLHLLVHFLSHLDVLDDLARSDAVGVVDEDPLARRQGDARLQDAVDVHQVRFDLVDARRARHAVDA